LGQVPLQEVADTLVVPACGGEKPLECSRGGAEGDGLGRLAGEVGGQAPAVAVKVGGRAFLDEQSRQRPRYAAKAGPKPATSCSVVGFPPEYQSYRRSSSGFEGDSRTGRIPQGAAAPRRFWPLE
jgi:hypothetical protein